VAHYLVRARPKQDRLAELEDELRRGAFVRLEPFGREVSRVLADARVQDDGATVWEEEDYCRPPLAQERAAVLDAYFDTIEVEAVGRGDGWSRIEALPRLFPGLPAE
jgi:hypothetical protein